MRRRFGREHLEKLFLRIDAELASPAEMLVIGGAAVALQIPQPHLTSDLDLWERCGPALREAIDRAIADDPDPPDIDVVTIGQAPYDFHDRIWKLEIAGLQRLTVMLPDRHDLSILKLTRCAEHDIAAIEALHRALPMQEATLIQRFIETDTFGHRRFHELALLDILERLFGVAAEIARSKF